MGDLDLIIIRVCRMYRSPMMVGMGPAKCLGLVETKETEDFIKKRVYTAGLENCSMTEFVPTRIAKRIHGPIDIKCGNCPPALPRKEGQISCDTEQHEVRGNMNPGVNISTIGQLL